MEILVPNQVMLVLFSIAGFSKKKKYKTDETICKYKAKLLVVRDYAQKNNIDYKETFSIVKYDRYNQYY